MIKVIIADDEARICRLIENLVNWEAFGMEVAGLAHNGIDCLRFIETEKPQLVITDIRMPGYDGLEMIRRAKEIDLDVEFILISGYEEFAYAQKAIEFGVRDYLSKPINKDRLDSGDIEGATKVFQQAWLEATDDYERFIAAYHVALRQKSSISHAHFDGHQTVIV